MSATRTRRPLPALIFLLVLLIAAAVVWWRVLQSDPSSEAKTIVQPTFSLTCAPSPVTFPQPKSIQVTVLNGNGAAGLAQKVSTQLAKEGFAVGQPADAGTDYSGYTRIVFGADGRRQAQALSYFVPHAEFLQDARSGAGVDLVIGQKFTKLTTTATARAALARAQQACS